MTRLRFVGELPLWLGLLLAAVVAALAWRYYRRESFDLPRRLRWVLPLLRSLAFFLGIMILTGPVLHHRKVVGELGRVQIYVDASQSMSLLDTHVTTGRKLLIAEQQGWMEPGRFDTRALEAADGVAESREEALAGLQGEKLTADDVIRLRTRLLDSVKRASDVVGGVADHAELIAALEAIGTDANVDAAAKQLIQACEPTRELEQLVRDRFDAEVQRLVDSGDESVRAALAMFDETPRWRRAERSLLNGPDGSTSLFDNLRKNHNVEVFALRDQEAVKLLDGQMAERPPQALGDSADSVTSDLTTGITASQTGPVGSNDDAVTGAANTAIVLMTDGQHNSGPSPIQTARILGGQGVAFYPIAMGGRADAPDVAVIGLEHPQMVFRKDRVRGTVIVSDRMPAGQTMAVRIEHDGDVMWEQQLQTDGTGERRVSFDFDIEELVKRLGSQFASDVKQHALPMSMTASITPLQDEAEINNNQRTMRFAAITQNHRMLIIDGRSRWETRYLRNVFERDSQWDVSAMIVGPGNDMTSLPRGAGQNMFPETRAALFEYDIIIFGEVAAELFADHEFQWIRDFVETRGGGIVFIDGQRQRLRAFNQQNLGPLLPVEWQAEPFESQPISLMLTDKGAGLSALTFETDAGQNRRFWSQLPPPHSVSNVTALPGSEVLVEATVDGNTTPAVVTRRSGAGRVLYLAFDETWRWRYKAADTYHQRIWNQLARFAMPRPFASSDEYLAIDTGAMSYASDDSAPIRVRLSGLDGKPAIDATVDALLWKDGRVVSTTGLTPDADVPGLYRGNSGALSQGEYEVSIRASGFSEAALKARGQFVVQPTDSSELTQTACNEPLLRQMATDSGGVFLREEQIGQLSDVLRPLSSGHVEESDLQLWQSYWWFAAIVILLAVEWFLRKRAGLL